MSSKTVIIFVASSRTDLHDDVVDVTSFSALDVVEKFEKVIIFVVIVIVVGARRN